MALAAGTVGAGLRLTEAESQVVLRGQPLITATGQQAREAKPPHPPQAYRQAQHNTATVPPTTVVLTDLALVVSALWDSLSNTEE